MSIHSRRGKLLLLAGVAVAGFLCLQLWTGAFSPGTKVSDVQIPQTKVRPPVKISLAELTSLTEALGTTFGAGRMFVAQLDDQGAVVRSIPTDIAQVAGISAYEGQKLVIGDAADRSVKVVNLENEQTTRLFSLSELNAAGIRAASALADGVLKSVASDGRNVFIALAAGYSSSIFKVDPSSKRVLQQTWAPGPDPRVMNYAEGILFVLDGESNQVRSYDQRMNLNYENFEVAPPEVKGLAVKGGKIRFLTVPAGRLSVSLASVDKLQVFQGPTLVAARQIPREALVPAIPQKYALLICGDRAESGYDEFWNDTVWLYKTLLARGYTAENIFVLYGNGTDYKSANPAYQHSGTVTDMAATVANVNAVLDGLRNGDPGRGLPRLRSIDTLFIWTFDHGSGGAAANLCLMDGDLSDVNFAARANAIAYEKRAIFMQQCRSGGFIDNLTNSTTFISTACRATENAHRADTEYETYGGRRYNHGEYNYYIISAIAGATPAGSSVNADANADKRTSSLEVHNWMTRHENRTETPQMENSGGIGNTFLLR